MYIHFVSPNLYLSSFLPISLPFLYLCVFISFPHPYFLLPSLFPFTLSHFFFHYLSIFHSPSFSFPSLYIAFLFFYPRPVHLSSTSFFTLISMSFIFCTISPNSSFITLFLYLSLSTSRHTPNYYYYLNHIIVAT